MNAVDHGVVGGSGSLYAPPTAVVEDVGDGFRSGDVVVYAGFWRRTAALCIDSILVGVVFYALFFAAILVLGRGSLAALGGAGTEGEGLIGSIFVMVYLAYPIASALYYVGMESSGTQATLGKMAVGIKVTDADGRRLGRGQAFGRWVSHLLCYVTFYIGYLMAALTDRKRGLHDMVASTLVVDRWAYTSDPGRQKKGLGAVTIVVLSLIGLIYIGIILAIAIPAYQAYVMRATAGG